MTLVKTNSQNQMPRFLENVLLKDLMDFPEAGFSGNTNPLPAVNIKETEKQFELEIFAPGRSKDSFAIELDKNLLSVSSEVKAKKGEHQPSGRFTQKEFALQSFKRNFKLPVNKIETEKIEAGYENGVLKLIIPKKEELVQKPKKIEIN